jgi:hypothetical protein
MINRVKDKNKNMMIIKIKMISAKKVNNNKINLKIILIKMYKTQITLV